ncbi:hypothetical protein [Pseudomonas sp.]|uniref:hypothetical protein n=1 Tax=Pseudomonas sp. TaxID=306 RepID=UPI00258DA6F6|nr:hypothetical protein [Pseudomonas sp.]
MTRLALILLLLATGASAAPAKPQIPDKPENVIQIERDALRGVTCYILNGNAISCVPDSQLKPEVQAKQTQAPQRRADERYSM